MLNPIQELERRLQERLEEAELTMNPPQRDDEDVWFLDIACYGKDLQVQWWPKDGFTITYLPASYAQMDTIFTRVVVMLQGERHLALVR